MNSSEDRLRVIKRQAGGGSNQISHHTSHEWLPGFASWSTNREREGVTNRFKLNAITSDARLNQNRKR